MESARDGDVSTYQVCLPTPSTRGDMFVRKPCIAWISGFLSNFCVGKYSLPEFFLRDGLELAAMIQDSSSSDDF